MLERMGSVHIVCSSNVCALLQSNEGWAFDVGVCNKVDSTTPKQIVVILVGLIRMPHLIRVLAVGFSSIFSLRDPAEESGCIAGLV